MDKTKRATLELIQLAVRDMLIGGQIGVADAGKQLLLVALDYVDAGELLAARAALAACDKDYFSEHMPKQRRYDRHFDRQVAEVDAVFGLEYIRPRTASA